MLSAISLRCWRTTAFNLILLSTLLYYSVDGRHVKIKIPAATLPKTSVAMCKLICEKKCHHPSPRPCACRRFCENSDPLTSLTSDNLESQSSKHSAICSTSGHALPTLLILGVQKSGTTTLASDLISAIPALLKPHINPNVDKPWYEKELHFFDNPSRYSQGSLLYGRYFPDCETVRKSGYIPMDACPNYFAPRGIRDHPESEQWQLASRFFESDAGMDSKRKITFVVTFRDPAHRFVSAYNHLCVHMNSTGFDCAPTLLEAVHAAISQPGCAFSSESDARNLGALDKCWSAMLKMGIYWMPLQGWVRQFPETPFVMTTFTHYLRDPESVVNAIAESIREDHTPVTTASSVNVLSPVQHDSKSEINEALRLLDEYYKPHTALFWDMLADYLTDDQSQVTFYGDFGKF